jgi:uncharacterized membrane protein
MVFKKSWLGLAACAFFIILIPWYLIKAISYNCYNAIDFSIYQQAIYQIAANLDFNPFVIIRKIRIFNDHLDPIIFLAAPFVRAFNYHFSALILWEWIFFLSLFISTYVLSPRKSIRELLPYWLTIALSKGLIDAQLFPIHPTTWSMLPLFLASYFLVKEDYKKGIIFLFITLFFREAYYFCFISLSIYFLIKKEWKYFFITSSIGLFSLWFLFFGWEMLLGPRHNHGAGFITVVLNNPSSIFKNFRYDSLLKIIYPFFIPFVLAKNKTKILPVAFILSPLFMMHFLAGNFSFHYSSIFVSSLLGAFFALDYFKNLEFKKVCLIAMIFLASSLGSITKMIKLIFINQSKSCEINSESKASIRKLKKSFSELSEEDTILASGGIIPNIVAPNIKIYHLKGWSEHLATYDYLIIEKNKKAEAWPINYTQLQAILKSCQQFSSKIIQDDNYIYFAKGSFPKDCFFHLPPVANEFIDYNFK